MLIYKPYEQFILDGWNITLEMTSYIILLFLKGLFAIFLRLNSCDKNNLTYNVFFNRIKSNPSNKLYINDTRTHLTNETRKCNMLDAWYSIY